MLSRARALSKNEEGAHSHGSSSPSDSNHELRKVHVCQCHFSYLSGTQIESWLNL